MTRAITVILLLACNLLCQRVMGEALVLRSLLRAQQTIPPVTRVGALTGYDPSHREIRLAPGRDGAIICPLYGKDLVKQIRFWNAVRSRLPINHLTIFAYCVDADCVRQVRDLVVAPQFDIIADADPVTARTLQALNTADGPVVVTDADGRISRHVHLPATLDQNSTEVLQWTRAL